SYCLDLHTFPTRRSSDLDHFCSNCHYLFLQYRNAIQFIQLYSLKKVIKGYPLITYLDLLCSRWCFFLFCCFLSFYWSSFFCLNCCFLFFYIHFCTLSSFNNSISHFRIKSFNSTNLIILCR